jgi:hypothetical protein
LEDGISKGFKLSADQAAASLTMLAQMTGNDSLWQGEYGAKRLSEMNSGLENATSLQSASDIIAFRAAQSLAPEGSSYVEAQKILEGGLTEHPELFNKYMEMTSEAEGGGYEGIIERMRQTFGLNYTNADVLYKAWQDPNKSDEDYKNLYEGFKDKPLPNANSPELQTARISEEIKNMYTQLGQTHLDKNFDKLIEEHRKIKEELINALRGGKPVEPAAPAPAATGEITLSGGGKVPANYYGQQFGVINEPGGKDFKAEMSYLMREIAEPYNRATSSPEVMGLYETYKRMTSGTNGNDTILDKSEAGQLVSILSKIAESKDMTAVLERLVSTLDHLNISVEVN